MHRRRRLRLLTIPLVVLLLLAAGLGGVAAASSSFRHQLCTIAAPITGSACRLPYDAAAVNKLRKEAKRFNHVRPLRIRGTLEPGPASHTPLSLAASSAAQALAGTPQTWASWNPLTGLWGHWSPGAWWQSGLAVRALSRYLVQIHGTSPVYQEVLDRTYDLNIRRPGTNMPRDFANEFFDDTGWWGLGWLEAAQYEYSVRHDVADASRFLAVAEWIARYIARQPRACGGKGIGWQVNYPPDTITDAEFVSLTAGLAAFREAPGYFNDPGLASHWLSLARFQMSWLERSGLVVLRTGRVRDSFNGACKVVGTPITYTEGEVADALVQMGNATHDRSYYQQAVPFLDWVFRPASGMVSPQGVLQEPCEGRVGICSQNLRFYNLPAYKGIYLEAVLDWQQATGSTRYDAFLTRQAQAVLANDVLNVDHEPSDCRTSSNCQLGFYWSRRVDPEPVPLLPSAASQTSGLDALIGGLVAAGHSA